MPQKPIIRKPPPILSADSLAGFWPRAGAFVIDYLALAAIGWALVSAFFDSLAALGPAAAIIGYAAAALFFAFFESGLGGGQSPGKRLIGIRAARADGGMLAPRRALLRAAIKAAPFYFPAQFVAQDPFSQWRWHCALFGLFVALAYPVAGRGGQGRTSRQSFHDYLTGAHVIRAPRPEPDENEREQAMRAFAPLADAPPPPQSPSQAVTNPPRGRFLRAAVLGIAVASIGAFLTSWSVDRLRAMPAEYARHLHDLDLQTDEVEELRRVLAANEAALAAIFNFAREWPAILPRVESARIFSAFLIPESFFTQAGGDDPEKLRLREWRAQVRIARPPEDGEAAAQRVARALLRAYPHLESGELLAVVFYRAADIGLWARAAQTARFERRPEEW